MPLGINYNVIKCWTISMLFAYTDCLVCLIPLSYVFHHHHAYQQSISHTPYLLQAGSAVTLRHKGNESFISSRRRDMLYDWFPRVHEAGMSSVRRLGGQYFSQCCRVMHERWYLTFMRQEYRLHRPFYCRRIRTAVAFQSIALSDAGV